MQIKWLMECRGGHLAYGDGVLPLERFLQELADINYGEYISMEIISDRYHLNPESAIKRSLGWLEMHIGKR